MLPAGESASGGRDGERARLVRAPMLCLCTTLGEDGLTARLLVVLSGSALGAGRDARFVTTTERVGPTDRPDIAVRPVAAGVAAKAAGGGGQKRRWWRR